MSRVPKWLRYRNTWLSIENISSCFLIFKEMFSKNKVWSVFEKQTDRGTSIRWLLILTKNVIKFAIPFSNFLKFGVHWVFGVLWARWTSLNLVDGFLFRPLNTIYILRTLIDRTLWKLYNILQTFKVFLFVFVLFCPCLSLIRAAFLLEYNLDFWSL